VSYKIVDDELGATCEKVALDAWRLLNCRDAGRVDIRLDEKGMPHFLEVNPLAGIHPEHSDLPIICNLQGFPYKELIRSIMDSALSRYRI
jgi:D-alanine-D-alanine ligase